MDLRHDWRPGNVRNGGQLPLQLADKKTSVGGTITFTATQYASPPRTYQWAKGAVPIPGATSSTLTLANISASDAGD